MGSAFAKQLESWSHCNLCSSTSKYVRFDLDSLGGLRVLMNSSCFIEGSVFYYYVYKRTAYRLSDPRFYEDSEWLRNEFEKRH